MNRNQRATRNNTSNNKPFVSGGVISNFTGAQQQNATVAPAAVPTPAPVAAPAPANVSFSAILCISFEACFNQNDSLATS